MEPHIQPDMGHPGTLTEAERLQRLREVHAFAKVPEKDLALIARHPDVVFQDGERMLAEDALTTRWAVLLQGKARMERRAGDLKTVFAEAVIDEPSMFGEIGLLSNSPAAMTITSIGETHVLLLPVEEFWQLLSESVAVRTAILKTAVHRSRLRQDLTLREKKMAGLGLVTAGLMHELNNPGSAAGRAASQLRENLNRMHRLARHFSEEDEHPSKKKSSCIWDIQERILSQPRAHFMSSLDQADAEEHLLEWIEENCACEAWKLAPTLASSGITAHDLDCIKAEYDSEDVSKQLSWVEAMVNSMQMVETIEESIGRIGTLVNAVKTYTHEGQGEQTLDVNRSIFATVVIMKHKMRERNISLLKDFADDLPFLPIRIAGLNQVWTNLLDNAIDAAGEGGKVEIKTELRDGSIVASFVDNGSGIPEDKQSHIFDPFFTTKPAGVGTGLGLGIAFNIVRQYGGDLRFETKPGRTEFIVRIPLVLDVAAAE